MIINDFVETISWSFIDYKLAELLGINSTNLLLKNPISSEMNYLRTSLVAGLINSYQKNLAYNQENLFLFEIGNIFLDDKKHSQNLAISAISSGTNLTENIFNKPQNYNLFNLKANIEQIFTILHINPKSLTFSTQNLPPFLHPYRGCNILLGRKILGYFGQINPLILKKLNLKKEINFFEIILDPNYLTNKAAGKKPFSYNNLPIVQRDFAFLIDDNIVVGEMLKTVENSNKNLIQSVVLFDLYQNDELKKMAKKSIAFKIYLQPIEKTFTTSEINEISQKIIQNLASQYNAKLRDGIN